MRIIAMVTVIIVIKEKKGGFEIFFFFYLKKKKKKREQQFLLYCSLALFVFRLSFPSVGFIILPQIVNFMRRSRPLTVFYSIFWFLFPLYAMPGMEGDGWMQELCDVVFYVCRIEFNEIHFRFFFVCLFVCVCHQHHHCHYCYCKTVSFFSFFIRSSSRSSLLSLEERLCLPKPKKKKRKGKGKEGMWIKRSKRSFISFPTFLLISLFLTAVLTQYLRTRIDKHTNLFVFTCAYQLMCVTSDIYLRNGCVSAVGHE
uniref:Uncharacterized protein n=1 Tax=Trypanosoma vivax (strain Y486) TaxID=1055687 RepID=G0U8V9_TRYVY|nr:hypothetical protein TVY486_1115250 [Trypanosoma vivax Y486]